MAPFNSFETVPQANADLEQDKAPSSVLIFYFHRRIAAACRRGSGAKAAVCCRNREPDTTFFA